MKYTKCFHEYHDLIQKLKDKNLIINDIDKAIETLKNIHYYRLSAYFKPFQSQENMFDDHISFDDILTLYHFDDELRRLVFTFISKLEISLRAKIVHIHTKTYNPFGYLNQINSLKRDLRINGYFLFYEFITQVDKEKRRANEDFIDHFKEKYHTNDLPLWATVEILSFGALSKFFKLMKRDEQKMVLDEFKSPIHPKVFENWLQGLTVIRNLSAHHARLWNKEIGISFEKPKKYNFLCPNINRKKIFFALSVIAEILKDPSIKSQFKALLEQNPHINTKAMGIPHDWESLMPWQNL